MNNWHRRMWKLAPIPAGSFIHELFDPALTNVFWFEPCVASDANALQFRVKCAGNAMAANWLRVTLTPKGDQPFTSVDATADTDTTERLEGAIDLEDAPLPLKFYINKNVTPNELVFVVGEGDGGGAGVGKGQDNN